MAAAEARAGVPCSLAMLLGGLVHLLLGGVGAAVTPLSAGSGDPRDMHSAVQLGPRWSYCDQSYCVVLPTPAAARAAPAAPMNNTEVWLCTITVSSRGKEGQAGMHVVSVRSTDTGRSWSQPVALERNSSMDNVYSTIIGPTAFGRVYAVYNANVDGLLPSMVGGRVDTVGNFYMKWTDDSGLSWSAQRLMVPYRMTAVDRANSFPGHPKMDGTIRMMWTVDQAKVRDGVVYFAFTKIGGYPQDPPEEGWILASANILTATDANAVRWSLLPDGDHGLVPVGATCAFPSSAKACVAEEFHTMPLSETAGHFAVFRTTQGFLGATHTRDANARGGWVSSYYAQYFNVSSTRSLGLKNTRGPVTLKRFQNGLYLLLYYNNDECVSILCPHRRPDYQRQPNYEDNRNPVWIAAGMETEGGTIEFSQPEIVLYNRSSMSGNETCEPGYADFIETAPVTAASDQSTVGGTGGTAASHVSIVITQKTLALCARVEPTLISMLWSQLQQPGAPPVVSSEGLVLRFMEGVRELPLPPGALPSLSAPWRTDRASAAGITVEIWLRSIDQPVNSTVVSIGNADGPHGGLALLAAADGAVEMRVSDGKQAAVALTTDAACARALTATRDDHHVVLVLDAGPLIALFVVDGVLCDGGTTRWRGWEWLPQLGDVTGGADRVSVGAYCVIDLTIVLF